MDMETLFLVFASLVFGLLVCAPILKKANDAIPREGEPTSKK
jgi:hypothetical protein